MIALALALAGCAGASPHLAVDGLASPAPSAYRGDPTLGGPASIRFDNEGDEYVHVYLVGGRRQWHLGRVEAGARATLRIPDETLADGAGWMRLSVLAGERIAVRPLGGARSATMELAPMSAILTQRWSFSKTFSGGVLSWVPRSR